MASAPEIPGFYYDADKRKYFKIEAHGPSSNPYSATNIAKRRKAASQSLKQSLESDLLSTQLSSLRPLQRFTNSSFSLRGYMNAREIGTPTSGAQDKQCLHAKMLRRQRVWKIRESGSSNSLDKLTCFALDEYTGDAVLGTHGGLVSAMSTALDESDRLPHKRMHSPQTAVTRFTSSVTSLSLSSTRAEKTLVCCSQGNAHNSGTIHIGKFTRAPEDRQYGLEVYAVMKPREQQSLFCTTISRYTQDLFAVGAENVVFVAGGLREQRPMLNIRSNCLAVEFLGEHTLAAGRRSGDIRGQAKLQETGLFVNHVSSVTHMRQLEDHFLVVAGLQNSLSMYDLRNVKPTLNAQTGKRESIPVIKYSGHDNSVSFRLGLDISPSGSILAAGLMVAGEDGYVRLWSVMSGQRIHARVSERAFSDGVVGLQFSETGDGLWIAGQEVEYWSAD